MNEAEDFIEEVTEDARSIGGAIKDAFRKVTDRISAEPILLWAVLVATWEWQFPEASVQAEAIALALGVLFQRSLSSPEVKVKQREIDALALGAVAKESEVNAFLASQQEAPSRPIRVKK